MSKDVKALLILILLVFADRGLLDEGGHSCSTLCGSEETLGHGVHLVQKSYYEVPMT